MPFDTSCFPRTFQWVLVAGAAVALLGVATNRARAQKSPDKASLVPPVSLESLSPQGRWLEFKAGQKRRVHLWHEAGIWHFRCTCGINATAFDGSVSVDKGSLRIVGGEGDYEQRGKAGKLTNPKRADYVQLTPGGLRFRFQCVGDVNGLDFVVAKEAKSVRCEFLVNGEADAESVFIGAAGEHPSRATFLLPAHP